MRSTDGYYLFKLKLGVLHEFYEEMIDHGHQSDAEFETVIGHLIYDYEQSFQRSNKLLLNL